MFKTIAQFFQNLFSKFQANKEVQEFEDFCGQVFTAEKSMIFQQIKDLAMAAVTSLLSSALTGLEKKASAMQSVTTGLKNAGITALASDVSLVIEMALTAVKNNSGNKGTVNGQSS